VIDKYPMRNLYIIIRVKNVIPFSRFNCCMAVKSGFGVFENRMLRRMFGLLN
jgi:hypothetical protein